MILALDSYYVGDACNTSLVVFETDPYNTVYYTDTIYTTVTCEYIPGEFYKRELTGIQEILNKLMTERPDIKYEMNRGGKENREYFSDLYNNKLEYYKLK